MDKLDLFKELDRLALSNGLGAEDIRLYLLLLANCRGLRKGQIEYAIIKTALGREFSLDRLKKSCQRLFVNNLVEVTSGFPDKIYKNDFTLSYLLLPTRDS